MAMSCTDRGGCLQRWPAHVSWIHFDKQVLWSEKVTRFSTVNCYVYRVVISVHSTSVYNSKISSNARLIFLSRYYSHHSLTSLQNIVVDSGSRSLKDLEDARVGEIIILKCIWKTKLWQWVANKTEVTFACEHSVLIVGNFLASWEMINFWRRTVFHRVSYFLNEPRGQITDLYTTISYIKFPPYFYG